MSRVSVDRQVHFVAGTILLVALLLGATVSPTWFYLAALPCFGLFLDAVTGICPMRAMLAHAPWNRTAARA